MGMIIALILFIVMALALVQYKAYYNKIDMIDVFMLMSVLYFGVWPVIVIGYNPDLYRADSFIITLSTFIVSLSLLAVWGINLVMLNAKGFRAYRRFISLDGFLTKARDVSVFKIYLLVFLLILFVSYSFLVFGITRSFNVDEFVREGIQLPVWYLVVYSSVRFLILLSVMLASVKLAFLSKKNRVSIVFLFILTILLSILFGRASIIMAIFSFFFIFIKIKQVHFIKFKTITILIFLIFFGYVSSNFFQHMRSSLLSPFSYVGGVGVSDVFSQRLNSLTVEALLSPDKLVNSLNERPSVWKFNVMVLDWQYSKNKIDNVPYGELLLSSWLMLIPRVIWEDKPPNNLQEYYLFPMYNQSYEAFQAPSLIGYLLADFGLFSILIFPLMLLSLALLISITARIFGSLDVAYIMFSVSFMFNVLSVESNYDSYIMVFRSALFFSLCFLAICKVKLVRCNSPPAHVAH